MPVLSLAQRRAGRELGSASAVADSKQTLLCTYLSAALLVGLVLNACSAGRGPTPSPRWSSRRSLSAKASMPGAATRAARERTDHARRRTRAVRRLRSARIRLAQLASTPPHRFDRLPRHQWPRRFDRNGSPASASSSRWPPRFSRRVCNWPAWWSALAFLHAPWIQLIGIVVAVAGIAATVYAQVDMGDSWRIGVDPSETTTLVRTGVFGIVRNPIFTAMFDVRASESRW